jgi:hypothetical protein
MLCCAHTERKQREKGKLAYQVKPCIFVWYGFHLCFSACHVLDSKTRRVQKLEYEQIKFHLDCFPWQKDSNKEWQPLEIVETTYEQTTLESEAR